MNKIVKTKSGTKIEWAEQSWNPVVGCEQITSGCKNCYAKSMHNRHFANPKQPKYIKPFNHVMEWEDELKKPYEWKDPLVVFVCSMSDLFNKDVSEEFIRKIFKVMNESHHQYRILTKRSVRMKELAPSLNWTPNIWAGVTVESGKHVSRIDDLREVPAAVRFLSVEPLIGDLGKVNLTGIHWVIAGGESGNSLKTLRKTEYDWVVNIKDKCVESDIPFFFKQWGREEFNPDPKDPTIPVRGKKTTEHSPKGGHLLDGVEYSEAPEFVEYWGVAIVPDIKEEIDLEEQDLHKSIKTFSQSWIDIGKSLAFISGKIDECGGGRKYWQSYLGVDSFQDYCKKKLHFSREKATQMRQAFTIIQKTKPDLLDGEVTNIPSYTKLRVLGPHIDKIAGNPENYPELIDTAFDISSTSNELNKVVRREFPKPIKPSKSPHKQNNIFDWEEYLEEVEENISREIESYQQSKLRGIMEEIKQLLNLL